MITPETQTEKPNETDMQTMWSTIKSHQRSRHIELYILWHNNTSIDPESPCEPRGFRHTESDRRLMIQLIPTVIILALTIFILTKTYLELTSDTTASKIAENITILLLYTTSVTMLTVLVAQTL